MKKIAVFFSLVALALSAISAHAQINAGATFSGDGLRSFFFEVGNYYHVPEREVQVVNERAIPPEEVPVVFYVAQRARVTPAVVVDLRRRGMNWADIAFHFRMDPDIYYFPSGPPYGKAKGYWKNHRPRDVEVVDAVNVHFLADHYRMDPSVIVQERSKGRSYVVVADNFKGRKNEYRKNDEDHERGKGRGKGHGKGRDD